MLLTPAAHEALADKSWSAETALTAIASIVADEDLQRSLWVGETGIRLVPQRAAPSQANLKRLSERSDSDGLWT
jgi:hypothetical protein